MLYFIIFNFLKFSCVFTIFKQPLILQLKSKVHLSFRGCLRFRINMVIFIFLRSVQTSEKISLLGVYSSSDSEDDTEPMDVSNDVPNNSALPKGCQKLFYVK